MTFKMSDTPQTIKIYNLRSDTNEFIGAGDAYIPPHTGLPANCTDIVPPGIPASHIAIFDAETETWSLKDDAPRDKCTLSCAINGIHAAFHYLKKNYISGCVMTVPTG